MLKESEEVLGDLFILEQGVTTQILENKSFSEQTRKFKKQPEGSYNCPRMRDAILLESLKLVKSVFSRFASWGVC